MPSRGWEFQWLGWSPWLAVIIACSAIWLVWVFYARYWPRHSPWLSFSAILLRCIVFICLAFILAGPIITQQIQKTIKPKLTIVVDDSHSMQHADPSMHPSYQLDEVQALKLLQQDARPEYAKHGAQLLSKLRSYIIEQSQHQSSLHIANYFRNVSSQIQSILPYLIGQHSIHDQLRQASRLLSVQADQIEKTQNFNQEQRSNLLNHIDLRVIAALKGLQQHADTALVAGAQTKEEITLALQQWKALTRNQRSLQFIRKQVIPYFNNKVDIQCISMQAPEQLRDLKQDAHAAPHSDFYHCLNSLNRQLSSEQDQRILLLSDGVHTGDRDPLPLARSLGARDIAIDAVTIGDYDQPRDAAVLAIVGPSEIYRADDIPIVVRYRITNYPGQAWSLILSINGSEYTRDVVFGNDLIQERSFIISGLPATRLKVEATLKPHLDATHIEEGKHAWLEDIWINIPKDQDIIDFFEQKNLPGQHSQRRISTKEMQHNRYEHFIRRLRSYVVAPESGWYEFLISGDDQTQLWLSTDHRPQHKSLLAYNKKSNKRLDWNNHASQRSGPVYLRKNQVFYLEALHRDRTHFDHIDIAWITPSQKKPQLIHDKHLIPFRDKQVARHLQFQEEHNRENNRREHLIIAHSDPLRLLILDQYPRWETRLIETLLKYDDGIHIDHTYVANQQNNDPIFENLEQYDAVVLGDISSSFLNNQLQERLALAVKENGLLLIVIAGRQAMPHSFALGPLADVLPIRVNASQVNQQQNWQLKQKENDPLSRGNNITWEWQQLPPLQWINTQGTLKPEARLHIMAHTKDGPEIPYCSSLAIGAGRVVYFASDESWRWRQHIGKQQHRKWWRLVLQWGLQSRLHGTDPRLRIAISQRMVDHADEIIVHARCYENGKNLSDKLELKLTQLDGKRQQWSFSMPPTRSNQSSLRIGDVVDLPTGHYRCTVQSLEIAHLSEQREFWVRPPQQTELHNLGTDPDFLRRLCTTSGGHLYSLADYKDLFRSIEDRLSSRQQTHTSVLHLWRSWYLLIAIIACLAAEWWIRKRVGLP